MFRPKSALLRFLPILAAVALIAPASALADDPGIGQLLVPGDHHLPGETIQITGYDLDPGAELSFQLVASSATASIASAFVQPDGTVAVPAVVPAAFPLGYAQVVGTNNGGDQWSTTVLIGERAEGPNAQAAMPLTDVDSVAVAMLGIGLLLVVVAAIWYLRGRRRADAPGT